MYDKPKLLLAGDSAVLLELANTIDEKVNRRVRLIASSIETSDLEGVTGVVPSYRSILIKYDPMVLTFDRIQRFLMALAEDVGELVPNSPKTVVIPTYYGGEFGPDLPFVATHNGITQEQVVELHSAPSYLVHMLGFAPGFAYLGGLPEKIATPRLATPRPNIPPGSVGIGGNQTGIYPVSSPGGWRIIGRTPLKLFDPGKSSPTILEAGDYVKFRPIPLAEFHAMSESEEAHGNRST